MQLNGIKLAAYSADADELRAELGEASVEEVAALDGQTLKVVDDEGYQMEIFAGYAVAAIKVEGDVIRLRAVRAVDPQTAEAIAGIEEDIKEVTESVRNAEMTAEDARADVEAYMDAPLGVEEEG